MFVLQGIVRSSMELRFVFTFRVVQITTGDRIAQLILERVRIADVEVVDNLDDTDRGEGGFGSTGGFGKQ